MPSLRVVYVPLFLGCMGSFGLGAGLFAGCAAQKPACAVIDLAHEVCDTVSVSYPEPDGGVTSIRIPRAELVDLSRQIGARQADSGPPVSP